MKNDIADDLDTDEDPLEKILARERSLYRTLSPFPDSRTGLTDIQASCLGRRYGHGGVLLQTERRSLARIFRSTANRFHLTMEAVCWEFFRLVQPVTPVLLFEQMPQYSSFINSTENTQIFQSQTFQEYLESRYLPELTEFGLDMLKDEVLCNVSPNPVGLPLHLVLGIGFDSSNKLRGTNFPPHNMAEVIDALLAKLESPRMNTVALNKIVRDRISQLAELLQLLERS